MHDYRMVDLDIIWDIIQNKLSMVEMQVNQILKE